MTSFLFQAHPVSMVYRRADLLGRRGTRRQIMRAYRDFLPTAPEELGVFVGLKTVPSMDPFPQEDWGKRACAVICCFNGPEADGQKALAPLLDQLPAPIFNWMGAMPFPAMQACSTRSFPKGLQWYWKGDFVKSLPDEAIDAHIAQAAKAPSDLSLMHLYPIDGAVRARRQGRDGLGRARRDLVDGDRRDRPEPAARPTALKTLGPRLLEGGAPVQPRAAPTSTS